MDFTKQELSEFSKLKKSELVSELSQKNKNTWQEIIDSFEEKTESEFLKTLSQEELEEILKEAKQSNSYLLKEHDVYEFILKEYEAVENTSDSIEREDGSSVQESLTFSYPVKCYFARKKLEKVEKDLSFEKSVHADGLQNFKFELESLNKTMKDLTDSEEKFNKDVRIGGRHPVTRKVILQKVAKFFDDSIKKKMALCNRYKIQIQSDVRERNKILSQIKAQEKRLASLDMAEFQETQFEHKKSCRQLAMHKEQLGKLKIKYGPLLQNLIKMKTALENEEREMEKMKDAVAKKEHLKEVMLTEKSRNDQKLIELGNAMRKIHLDPRRHNLPEVIDYAAAKRENAALKKQINKWKKRVEVVQQQNVLKLNTSTRKD